VGASSLFVAAGFLSVGTGCYNGPGYGGVGVVTQGGVVDDYTYYPGYEMYYSSTRHQYFYRDGRSWISRPQPPNNWSRDLANAPSVRVDFHDAPERHHAEIVKTYPKNWRPQAGKVDERARPENPRPKEGDPRGDERKEDRKDDHKDDRRP